MLVAVLLGRWILTTLFTHDYGRFQSEFQLVVLAHCLALVTNVLGIATTQMRLFWAQVPAQVITLAATVSAAFLLIPGPSPVLGAAHTALVRSGVQLVLYAGCVGLGLAFRSRLTQRASIC